MAQEAYDQLQPGAMVAERWRIVEKLDKGALGVYKVIDTTTNNAYVLKTEEPAETVQLLKMELALLSTMKANGADRHTCSIMDSGRVDNAFNYAVLTMVGQSLKDLLKTRPDGKLTLGCAISVGRQCLEAVEDVHRAGFLHRDVRPSRFYVGRSELGEQRRVFMLHFNRARTVKTEERDRSRGALHCTWPNSLYLPLAYHVCNEHNWARKDDLEQWAYTLVVLTKGALPWDTFEESKQMGEYKMRCHSDDAAIDELFTGCPRQFRDAWRLITSYTFYDTPDYARLDALLLDALATENAAEFPYDWELPAAATAN